MELTATRSATATRRLVMRLDPPALGAWTLGFALVAYLALQGGGYDTVVRGEVGVAIWWVVLLAAAAGLLPGRIRTAGLVAIGLLGAFAVWTGLAIGWSESAERSSVELGRVAAYLGVLVLAISLQGRTVARHTINGVASAIGLVTLLAVLSRVHPQAFPANDHFEFLGAASARKLSYPLNYWNALAAFAALGVPLLLAIAIGARTLAGQALAAAALPVSVLCVYLTVSRGGALALAVGAVAFLVLVPRRLDTLGTLLASGAGAAILVRAAAHRDALTAGAPTPEALSQGDQLLVLLLVVCAGVALLQVALGLAARHVERPPRLAPSRRAAASIAAGLVAAAMLGGVAAGVPGELQQRWHDFKAPPGDVVPGAENTVFQRLQATNGNGRFEFWKAAIHEAESRPLTGTGPGAFELWWSRHATTAGYIRDAHTLYFETLGETGIVGLALLGGMLLWLLAVAIRRSLRAGPELRVWLAAATGGLLAFMTSAALEWVWEMAAIAVAVMALAAVIVAGRDDSGAPDGATASRFPSRVALALVSAAALVAVLIPLAGARAIRDSQAAAADGRLAAALEDSRTAERLQPYAATPHLQRALVLESAGSLAPAAAAARAATAGEPTNWRPWLVLARIDARRGEAVAAIEELRRARRLNPYSSLFTQ
jgi:hypothetical protein